MGSRGGWNVRPNGGYLVNKKLQENFTGGVGDIQVGVASRSENKIYGVKQNFWPMAVFCDEV